MKKIKVMSVFGTRPEAIKMAPLVKELEQNSLIESYVTLTAQHREMLDQVINIFDLKVDHDLNIMKRGQTLTDITTSVITGLSEVLNKVKPDIILAHGDTTTTFSASLSAFYNNIKLGHVEAGLRTYDKYQPYPEEMNRVLTTDLADIHFAPTILAKQNLLKENINESSIYITGNTAIDAFQYTIDANYTFKEAALNNIDFNKTIIAMTAHRHENLGEPLENIFSAINDITEQFPEVEFVYAIHKNPLVRETATKIFKDNKQVRLIEPLDVKDMHNLMKKSYFIATDSGGIQEEAPSLGKPVLVLRNVTERPEGVEAGTLRLAGTNKEQVYNEIKHLLTNEQLHKEMSVARNPFGDGKASSRIVEAIIHYFGCGDRPADYC